MTLIHADRVKETSSITGTGSYTLLGAVTGFRTFLSAIGEGNTCFYHAVDASGAWEAGIGTVVGATLVRTEIVASSNSGAAVNWGAGTKTLACGNSALGASLPFKYREVTAAGDVTVQTSDRVIGVNKTVGAATNVNLGLAALRYGTPITVKDVKGDAGTNNITPVFSGGELCDGLAAASFVIAVNYAWVTFYPRSGGWFTL